MRQVYAHRLKALGVRITRAGFQVSATDGRYDQHGSHLAVYVVPTAGVTADDYVRRLVPVLRAFAPSVFDRYPRVQTFDVCQEPPGTKDADEPKPYTQVFVNRAASAGVDWVHLDAGAVARLANVHPNPFGLYVDDVVKASPAWRAVAG